MSWPFYEIVEFHIMGQAEHEMANFKIWPRHIHTENTT